MGPDAAAALLGLAILIGLLMLIVLPLIDSSAGKTTKRATTRSTISQQAERLAHLLEERNAIYTAIREIDFEHETNKLADGDHAEMRARLVQAGVAVLRQLDQLEAQSSADDRLEAAIAEVRSDDGEQVVDDDELEARINALRLDEASEVSIEAEG